MYLMKHTDQYVSKAGGLTPRQIDALRIDDTVAALIKDGYLKVHDSYRLVHLTQRNPVDSVSTAGGLRDLFY
jgi:hypothetical protein